MNKKVNECKTSNENSIVLDCFAGSGTTLKSAQTNGRQWIGIDESQEAIKAIIKKLDTVESDLFTAKSDYKHLIEKEAQHTTSGLALLGQDGKAMSI